MAGAGDAQHGRKVDALALGELLVDFVPDRNGVPLAEAERFVRAAGGAPANVAVGLARLGVRSGFLGKVGEDPFGRFLEGVLRDNGVDVRGLRFDEEARTALAFVSLTEDGDRDFLFYRHPSADMRHRPDEIDPELVAGAKLLHHGSISLITEPARSATLRAVELARAAGRLVSYDPNLRLPLWESEAAARAGILAAWEGAQVIKISDDELAFLTGSREREAARGLWHDELRLLVVTRGEAGVDWYGAEDDGRVAGFSVETVDTTGAGDAFVAALLAALVGNPALPDDRQGLEHALRRANAYAALATTVRGAIPALPTRGELESFLRERAP